MDESWKMRMGLNNLPRRRSTEETSSDRMRRSTFSLNNSGSETLDPDDFNDVFGGPPRSILFSRQISSEVPAGKKSGYFYDEIFRPSEFISPPNRGRNLPVFRIPATQGIGISRRNEGFYDDIFGSDEDRVSRSRSKSKPNSKSKSNSSSVLSSEDLSPLRSVITDDVVFSSFSSKFRPINASKSKHKEGGMKAFPSTHTAYMDFNFTENNFNDKNFRHCRSSRHVSSPETINLEPDSYQNIKISVDDLETDSPPSAISSLGPQDPQAKFWVSNSVFQNQEDQEEDEVMSSYVIEISSVKRGGTEELVAIDEAIAWAKEKFQSHSSRDFECENEEDNVEECKRESLAQTEERPITHECVDQQIGGHGRTQFVEVNEGLQKWMTGETKQTPENEREKDLLEEEIRLWASGKEGNIQLLLSTLHQILWANSGWCVIPLIELMEASQIKKAYQKARLCLHPDKLQQRGATLHQKYVAEKAFSILQDAWASFISRDVFFG